MRDLISRQEAIDALAKFVPYAIRDESTESYTNGLTDAYNLICQLPPAQPEVLACGEGVLNAQPEIVRCKDCANYDTDWIPETAPDRHYCLVMDCMMPKDGFCNYAERWEK